MLKTVLKMAGRYSNATVTGPVVNASKKQPKYNQRRPSSDPQFAFQATHCPELLPLFYRCVLIKMDGVPNVAVSVPQRSELEGTSEAGERYRQSSSKTLHKCIIFAIPTLAGFIQLMDGAGAAVYLLSTEYNTLVALIVDIVVYIGSWALAVRIAPENPDLSEFMDKISLSSGTLAITVELLIIFPPLGWFAIAVWIICLVIAVTKSYHEIADVLKSLYQRALEHLRQPNGASARAKEFFMNIGASAKVIASGMFDKLKELVMGSDQPNGASGSAGDVQITSVAV
ncbi:hypothetical protein C1H46_031799 [Malus baccata]|uniref:Uncharacterized protein n=1 Tax=Malus baccata TaxID=106549 RepID=A0A540L819_MALBA|nr:hypothetical protein C1H46_031799 [Malus baccata]